MIKKTKQHLITYFQGVSLGIAEIIPGVSGSTIALLFGIYDDFIDLLYQGSELVKVVLFFLIRKASWRDIQKQIKAIRWTWGIILGTGMLTAIVALASVITTLLVTYPHFLFAFLLGLTPPTMLIVYQQIHKPNWQSWTISAVVAVVFLSIFVFGGEQLSTTNPHPLHLFLGGMIGVSTMVLPGVSGSFMLLVLGLYNYIIGLVAHASEGLSNQELISLGVLLAGMAAGFLTTVRLLKWAFEKIRDQLMAFLLGLLTASWYVLWPFVKVTGVEHDEPILAKVGPTDFSQFELLLIMSITVATCAIVYGLHRYADTHDPTSPKADDGFDKL